MFIKNEVSNIIIYENYIKERKQNMRAGAVLKMKMPITKDMKVYVVLWNESFKRDNETPRWDIAFVWDEWMVSNAREYIVRLRTKTRMMRYYICSVVTTQKDMKECRR